jgi:hypothetical protein
MIKVCVIAFAASLGGLAVFVGLCMEKMAEREKDGYQTIDDFRKSDSRKKIGERFVRWGVFAEVVLGFCVGSWSGWQELKNNPSNQPIKSIEAEVDLMVPDGTNFDSFELSKGKEIAWVRIRENRHNFTNDVVLMGCDNFESSEGFFASTGHSTITVRDFEMKFRFPLARDLMGGTDSFRYLDIIQHKLTVKDLDNEKGLEVDVCVPGIKGNMPIVTGGCSLEFNGSIERIFSTPKFTDGQFVTCLPEK